MYTWNAIPLVWLVAFVCDFMRLYKPSLESDLYAFYEIAQKPKGLHK